MTQVKYFIQNLNNFYLLKYIAGIRRELNFYEKHAKALDEGVCRYLTRIDVLLPTFHIAEL